MTRECDNQRTLKPCPEQGEARITLLFFGWKSIRLQHISPSKESKPGDEIEELTNVHQASRCTCKSPHGPSLRLFLVCDRIELVSSLQFLPYEPLCRWSPGNISSSMCRPANASLLLLHPLERCLDKEIHRSYPLGRCPTCKWGHPTTSIVQIIVRSSMKGFVCLL